MRDRIKGAVFIVAGVTTWGGLGRKVLETLVIERVLHVLDPLIDTAIRFLIEFALPVAITAYGIYLVSGIKNKPAGTPVATWARWQLNITVDPSHLIWVGFCGAGLFIAVGLGGLVWQHFRIIPPRPVLQSPSGTVPLVPPPGPTPTPLQAPKPHYSLAEREEILGVLRNMQRILEQAWQPNSTVAILTRRQGISGARFPPNRAQIQQLAVDFRAYSQGVVKQRNDLQELLLKTDYKEVISNVLTDREVYEASEKILRVLPSVSAALDEADKIVDPNVNVWVILDGHLDKLEGAVSEYAAWASNSVDKIKNKVKEIRE
jgi:hypothetical protein